MSGFPALASRSSALSRSKGEPSAALGRHTQRGGRNAQHHFPCIRVVLAVVGLGLALSACGYNTIPTLQEQAKARWSDVQNQYQRRADLIPNLVATVQGYAAQEKNVLTAVVEARAKATQIKLDASDLTDPDKLKAFQDAQNQLTGVLGRLLAVTENYPGPQIERQFPGAAVAARRHRKPHRGGAARLYRRGASL